MFVETKVFTDQLARLASLETLKVIQSDLIGDPKRWPTIAGTNGARKGRVADPRMNKGKSGSFRYLYLYLEAQQRVYLLFLFGKSEQANLSPEQRTIVAGFVREIRNEIESTKAREKKADTKKHR